MVATPAVDLDDRPPSERWYRLAGVIAVVGILAALAWWPYAATRVHNAVYAFERTSPFGGRVDLDAGRHTLWIEGDCLSCRGNEPPEYRAVATVELRRIDVEGSAPVTLRPCPPTWLYNTGAREGRALYVFDLAESGTYGLRFSLDTSSSEWDNRPPANLAIGEGYGLPVHIVRPMATLAIGGITVALVLTGITMLRRRRFYERRYPAFDR